MTRCGRPLLCPGSGGSQLTLTALCPLSPEGSGRSNVLRALPCPLKSMERASDLSGSRGPSGQRAAGAWRSVPHGGDADAVAHRVWGNTHEGSTHQPWQTRVPPPRVRLAWPCPQQCPWWCPMGMTHHPLHLHSLWGFISMVCLRGSVHPMQGLTPMATRGSCRDNRTGQASP